MGHKPPEKAKKKHDASEVPKHATGPDLSGTYRDFEGTLRNFQAPGVGFTGGSAHFFLVNGPEGRVYPRSANPSGIAPFGYTSDGSIIVVPPHVWANNQPWYVEGAEGFGAIAAAKTGAYNWGNTGAPFKFRS